MGTQTGAATKLQTYTYATAIDQALCAQMKQIKTTARGVRTMTVAPANSIKGTTAIIVCFGSSELKINFHSGH